MGQKEIWGEGMKRPPERWLLTIPTVHQLGNCLDWPRREIPFEDVYASVSV